jgi:MoaA/NifB/PqqE/SkfB family radical SAM enzyme
MTMVTKSPAERELMATAEQALPVYRPEGTVHTKRPTELAWKTFSYLFKQKFIHRRKRFPLVTMLEPLEACNLACEGCGRIREYAPVITKTLTLEQCLKAVEDSGAPIVSIAGGEPTMYKELPALIAELVRRKIFVYCCLSWVIHLDGMEEQHDTAVVRTGVWKTAMAAAKKALEDGYRVCSNTTLFQGSNVEDLHELFTLVTDMGFEGVMVSSGYDFVDGPTQDMFLSREESIRVFKRVLNDEAINRIRFYNNPLYLSFLRGERDYQCTAWSNPTYTVQGWREPCYPLADKHTENVEDLFTDALWEKYGVGVNDKCANCMMHCGFESATIYNAISSPVGAASLIKGLITKRSGVGAP